MAFPQHDLLKENTFGIYHELRLCQEEDNKVTVFSCIKEGGHER